MIQKHLWDGRRVAITGNTGFKGAWLSYALLDAGAKVYGYALPPDTQPNLFEALSLPGHIDARFGDVRDIDGFRRFFEDAQPTIVFHFAAQPLVRRSYREPLETFEANVNGTLHCLELCRSLPSLEAVVVATSDKCYRNDGTLGRPFVEDDPLGGRDPYSASKGAAEIAVASYRSSFYNESNAQIATVRAGNVIGGGDWSEDRLIPDVVRAMFGGARPLLLRNPGHVRPWQHVLDALHGYLLVAQAALSGDRIDEAWNIGPNDESATTVSAIVDAFVEGAGRDLVYEVEEASHYEAPQLRLNSAKAHARLGFRSNWSSIEAARHAAEWYAQYYAGQDVESITRRQIAAVLC